MAVKFNPFTGQLQIDEKGSGGGSSYIDGEVEFFSDLPLSAATAPLDSAWLVRKPEGAWFLTKKHAGLYIRTATGGTDRNADYTYAGAGWPDVFSDANFTIYDDADTSKNLKFQLSGLATGTTSTLTVPASGTIARTEDFAAPPAIGSTTASTGAFTTLSASGTVSGTGFSNYLASPPAIGGTSAAAGSFTTLSASTSLTLGTSGILSGGTNTIEQRNTTSAQTFRIYNTVSGAADANYERGFMRWSSNVLEIGTEKAGTGSQRNMRFMVDGSSSFSVFQDQVQIAAGSQLWWQNRLILRSEADGNLRITNWAANGFGLLRLGGSDANFPALKRSSTTLQVRLADDSADAPLSCSTLNVTGSADLVAEFGTAAASRSHEILLWGNGTGRSHYIKGSATFGLVFRYGTQGNTAAIVGSTAVAVGFRNRSDGAFQWTDNSSNVDSGTPDLLLRRDAAGILAQYNGTNAQESRLYGTFTSSTNYQRMTIKSVRQTLSALSGASATTTGTFIPDGAVVVGVTTRVATALTGATGYTIGDGTDADRWGDITGTAIGTTSDNINWTAGTIECFTAGGNVTLTAKGSNFTAGAIEICVFYLAGEAD